MESTVRDVALIFEGGGMWNSYSAGSLTVMLENGLFFDDVYGLSAGATNAIDYLSRDVRRAEASFTASLDDLAFRWWIAPFAGADGVRAALHGHALARPGYALPFDFAAFQANPARATLQAIDRDSGALVSGPDIISRGFVYVRENEDIIECSRELARNIVLSYGQVDGSEWQNMKNRIKDELHRYIFDTIKRNPMILPILMEI